MGQFNSCFIFLGIIIACVLWLMYENTIDKKIALDETRLLYEQALTKLKADPANAYLREKTFDLGWKYASLTQKRKGVAVFDEAALMNDIHAAPAGTMKSQEPLKTTSGHKNFFDPPADGPNVRLGVALGAVLITVGAGFFVMAFMNPEDIIGICLFVVMGITSILMGILTIITVFDTRSKYEAFMRYIEARQRLKAERPGMGNTTRMY